MAPSGKASLPARLASMPFTWLSRSVDGRHETLEVRGADTAHKTTLQLLIVEDDAQIRSLLAAMVGEYRPDVLTVVAFDGAQAVGWLEAGLRPSLILTDLMMPNLHGEELLRWVREHRPGIPVVAVSAAREQAGFDGYLTKPFELADLQDCLRHWLPRPPSRRPSTPA